MIFSLAPSFREGLQKLCPWFRASHPAPRHGGPPGFHPTIEALEQRELLAVSILEYNLPSSNGGPIDIARGPDGNQWFVEEQGHKIAQITSSGSITEYALSGDAVDLWAGLNNTLWFTEMNANRVGKIDITTGQVTEYTPLTAGAGPNGITLGVDSNMWFAEYSVGKIGRITADGQITEYSVGGSPTDLALGSDGNVWFTSYNTNQVGKISTSGSVTLYAAPSGSGPAGMAAGPDGNLWVTEHDTGKIARVTTSGSFTEFSIPTSNSLPWAINEGPGATLWFAESGVNKIGRLTMTGQLEEYTLPTATSEPRGIVAAADGSIWWTEYAGNQIGNMVPDVPPSVSLSVTYGSERTVTLSGQVMDAEPGELTVNFIGMVNGSVVTNTDGSFSATFTATGLGLIEAMTTNGEGLRSSTAAVTLASNAPVISDFKAIHDALRTWTFQGKVTDESAVGLTVRFDGLPSLANKTATVHADGTFELTVELAVGEEGVATAQTTDWWGLDSNEANCLVVI